jgi:hypothetical protein
MKKEKRGAEAVQNIGLAEMLACCYNNSAEDSLDLFTFRQKTGKAWRKQWLRFSNQTQPIGCFTRLFERNRTFRRKFCATIPCLCLFQISPDRCA